MVLEGISVEFEQKKQKKLGFATFKLSPSTRTLL